MTNSQRLATVRACLLRWLATSRADGTSRDPSDIDNEIVRESILIRDEFYCGRQFHTATHRAVWFIEEDQLKIYDRDGEHICSLSGEEIDSGASLPMPSAVLTRPKPGGEPAVIKISEVSHAAEVEATHVDSSTGDGESGKNGESDSEIRRAA